MADLFDPSSSPPPPPTPPHTALNFTLESDDISSLVYTLLQNSSQISTSCPPAAHEQQPPAAPEERRLFARSGGFSHRAGMLDSPSGLNFRFAGGFYSSGANEPAENVSGLIGLSMEGIGEVECESQEQQEVPADPPPVRSSSKRSRAAEVHNLSEKRRRQRINEKMKALQKLIPNSNKTDKASMLDEAIEYLKQLQLQVQMLTLRNGSGLHPFYLPVTSQPVQSPQMPLLLDETNGSKVEVFPSAQEASVQTVLDLACKPASSDYKILIPETSEDNNSGSLFVTKPSTNAYYRRFNARMPSKLVFLQKGLCKDAALPQSHLDMNQGQSSSSGVSS